MSNSGNHHAINYIEFTVPDIEKAKQFYSRAFGWSFQDWGPDYASFDKNAAGIDGGFRKGETSVGEGGPLIVFYSRDLNATQEAIRMAGGEIMVPTFEFPGGRRFHFADGLGNVLAVWSE